VDGVPHSVGHQGTTHRSRGLIGWRCFHFVHHGFPPLLLQFYRNQPNFACSYGFAGDSSSPPFVQPGGDRRSGRIGVKDVTDDR
jgi:hypothetical protein